MKKPNSANMKKFFLLMACTVLGLGSCTERPRPLEIDNALTAEEIAAGRFTPEVMWKMGRLGGSQLSPDGKRLVYTVTYYNLGENRGVTALYLRDMASGKVRQLTDHTSNNTSPAWSADGRTLTVVLAEAMPTFLQLCAQPAYAPVPSGAADTTSWTADGAAFVTSGPYTVAAWTTEGLTYTKNPAYWDADNVAAETVRFVFQSDANAAASAFLAREYALSWPVPDDALDDLRANHAPELRTVSQLGTYSLCFSMSDPALSAFSQTERAQIRTALALLIDRSYLCSEITPGAQQSANAPIPPGVSDADGSAFTAHNGADGKGGGYYGSDHEANCQQAIALLRQAAESSGRFTVSAQGVCAGFPELTYLTSDAAGHVAIADYLTELYGRYGISLAVTAQDMDTFLASRAAGGYSITRCSFSADVDDPMPFLSLWASGAGSNCVALGRGAHADYAGYSITLDGRTRDNCTWAESYDALLYRIQSSGDTAERYSLMHQAETLLMQTGAVCPLYWYTDTYLCNTHVQGLLSGPLGAQYLMGAQVEK